MTQLQGLVIPTNWDEQGKILDVAIAAFDEDQIFVERNEDSEQLFNLIGQHVMVKGLLTIVDDQKRIKVTEILCLSSDPPPRRL